jgi:LuxR family maltose regulon positive regulatory protein
MDVEKSGVEKSGVETSGIEKVFWTLLDDLTAWQRSWHCPDSAWLVLDGFGHIDNPELLGLINGLLDNLPAFLHCIVTCRAIPGLDFSRRFAKGEMLHLGQSDFAFSFKETCAFFRQGETPLLTDGQIRAVFEKTAGWVGATELIRAILLNNQTGIARLLERPVDHFLLQNYLAEAALPDQSPLFMQDFSQVAHLPRFNKKLLSVLFDATDVQDARAEAAQVDEAQIQAVQIEEPRAGKFWKKLTRGGVLILPTDATRQWFCLHGLVGDWAKGLTDISQPSVRHFLLKAAQWFCDQDMFLDAFTIAARIKDWALVVKVVEKAVQPLLKCGKYKLAEELISGVPEKMLEEHHPLALMRILVIRQRAGGDAVIPLMDTLQGKLAAIEAGWAKAGEPLTASWRMLRAHANIVQADLARNGGRFAQASELMKDSGQLLLENQSPFSAWVLHGVGVDLLLQGNMDAAFEYLIKSLEEARSNDDGLCFLASICWLGPLFVYRGQLSSGLRFLDEWEAWILDNGFDSIALASVIDRARVLVLLEMAEYAQARKAREKMVAALNDLDPLNALYSKWAEVAVDLCDPDLTAVQQSVHELEELYLRHFSQWHFGLPGLECLKGVVGFKLGNPLALFQWSQHFPENSEPENYLRYIAEENIFVRVQIGAGKDMTDRINAMAEAARESGNLQRGVYAQVLHSLNALRQHRETLALRSLAKAITLAQASGFVRVFVDELVQLKPLLSRLPPAFNTSPAIRKLNQLVNPGASDQQTAVKETFTASVESSLSNRENEVLLYLAEGKSNSQISASMGISETTVKSHLRNIFSKLEVSRRTQAVAAARNKGWIG